MLEAAEVPDYNKISLIKNFTWNSEVFDIPEKLLKEAYKIPSSKEIDAAKRLDQFIQEKFKGITLFNKIKSPNGIPKKEFLKRLVVRRPYVRKLKENATVNDLLNKVSESILNEKSTRSELLCLAEKMRTILTHPDMVNDANSWVMDNTSTICDISSVYLRSENSSMIEEGCITISVLLFYQGKALHRMSNHILQDLLYSLSSISEVYDKYLNKVYELKKTASNTKKIIGNENFKFTRPRLLLVSCECKHDQIAFIVYTLTFLIHFCIDSELVIAYVNYLLVTTEYCRSWLLHIFDVLTVSYLRSKFKKEFIWVPVGVEVYYTLSRSLYERNSYNKKTIYSILQTIRDNSVFRLPQVDEFQMRIEQCYEKFLTEHNIKKSTLNETECLNLPNLYSSEPSKSIIEFSPEFKFGFERIGRKRSSDVLPTLDTFLSGTAREQMDATLREIQAVSKSGSTISDWQRKSTLNKHRSTTTTFKDTFTRERGYSVRHFQSQASAKKT